MPNLVELPLYKDDRGSLTVLEKEIPYPIKRIFYIYDVAPGAERGGHGHFKTKVSLIALSGHCHIRVNNGIEKNNYRLDSPTKCLHLNPEDWHILSDFSKSAVILVLASSPYDKEDYFYEEPK
ncbi:MAG: FdtA/QdtA family cupin domain-containing protein [Halobacteriovoraceae bacterium]|nr:FdtA/QdtA family cupin domain-containing protein [Halobacteriovoraceae bacterium]